MARINIDCEFWSDPRLHLLIQKIGHEEAIGSVINLWNIGQSYWKQRGKHIPSEVFGLVRFGSVLLDCKFIKKTDEGYYVCGAKERWGFLLTNVWKAKIGGLHSVIARHKKYGTSIPFGASNEKTQNRTKSEPPPNSPKSSSSSSRSYNKELISAEALCHTPSYQPLLISQERTASGLARSLPATPAASSPSRKKKSGLENGLGQRTQAAIAFWAESYKAKYGVNPPVGGKSAGQVKTLVKDYGLERVKQLFEGYLQLSDKRFIDACHPIGLLLFELTRIAVSIDKGVEHAAKDLQNTAFWEDFWKGKDHDEGNIRTTDKPA